MFFIQSGHSSSGNHRSSYQDYHDDRQYRESSKHGSSRHSDSKGHSGSQRSRDHKRHSRNGRSKSRGKHSSKQDTSGLGQVELQCCYDSQANILYVTVIRAKGLYTLREDGDTRPDPFVKVYLLPGRRLVLVLVSLRNKLVNTNFWNFFMVDSKTQK